jgi:hypothetical protein
MKLVAARNLRYSRTAGQAGKRTTACSPFPTAFEEYKPMSSKENVAVNQLLALLETRYALRVLWALKDGHPQTFRLLQDSVGGITPNTLNTRLKALA